MFPRIHVRAKRLDEKTVEYTFRDRDEEREFRRRLYWVHVSSYFGTTVDPFTGTCAIRVQKKVQK